MFSILLEIAIFKQIWLNRKTFFVLTGDFSCFEYGQTLYLRSEEGQSIQIKVLSSEVIYDDTFISFEILRRYPGDRQEIHELDEFCSEKFGPTCEECPLIHSNYCNKAPSEIIPEEVDEAYLIIRRIKDEESNGQDD